MSVLEVILPQFVILILSLSVHEAAHAWSADRLGDPTARQLGRLTLNPLAHIDWIGTVLFPLLAMYSGLPLIGWAKPVPVNWHNLRSPRRDFAMIAAAGPASNLVMAVIGAAIFRVLDPDGLTNGTSAHARIVWAFVDLNVLLAVFNMLPVPPLDGGNVLAGFVPEGVARMIDQLRPWGFFLLYFLMFAGVFQRFVWPVADVVLGWLQ